MALTVGSPLKVASFPAISLQQSRRPARLPRQPVALAQERDVDKVSSSRLACFVPAHTTSSCQHRELAPAPWPVEWRRMRHICAPYTSLEVAHTAVHTTSDPCRQYHLVHCIVNAYTYMSPSGLRTLFACNSPLTCSAHVSSIPCCKRSNALWRRQSSLCHPLQAQLSSAATLCSL